VAYTPQTTDKTFKAVFLNEEGGIRKKVIQSSDSTLQELSIAVFGFSIEPRTTELQ
jgi:hypothetical protein